MYCHACPCCQSTAFLRSDEKKKSSEVSNAAENGTVIYIMMYKQHI